MSSHATPASTPGAQPSTRSRAPSSARAADSTRGAATGAIGPADIIRLQRAVGNRAVGALLKLSGPPVGARSIQRAKADIVYERTGAGPQTVPGTAVGQGAVGGQTHSEQLVWKTTERAIMTALGTAGTNVAVEFLVDTTVCGRCSPWFEDTVWVALRDRARDAGSTFTLDVTVDGASVRVEGPSTIWPPEIADVHAFGRLSDYERAVRFLNEDRDVTSGRIMHEAHSGYVKIQSAQLQAMVRDHQIATDRIDAALVAGRRAAIGGQAVAFELPHGATMAAGFGTIGGLDAITLLDVLASGRMYVPDVNDLAGDTWNAKREEWYRELQRNVTAWMEEEIQDRFDDYRVRGEY